MCRSINTDKKPLRFLFIEKCTELKNVWASKEYSLRDYLIWAFSYLSITTLSWIETHFLPTIVLMCKTSWITASAFLAALWHTLTASH